MADTEVLIAGAGPTGLVLALCLKRAGVRVRLIDKAEQPGTASRALAVQARTLEFYRQLGLAEEVVAAGRRIPAVNQWVHGRRRARLEFAEYGRRISRYGFPLIYPQDEHETLLTARLAAEGVVVERPLELTSLAQAQGGVRASLRDLETGREEACAARYLVGCDGASSFARHAIGAQFSGGTYEHVFYVADVEASGPAMDGELHVELEDADFLAVFPLKDEGHVRLIGTIRDKTQDPYESLSFFEVSDRAMRQLKVEVTAVNWFSTYRVHHRVADRFHRGHVFLAGDAAHIHSPVGGQGMNTGIGDAVNLAWKLAMVVKGEADDGLLATYEPERIAFARRLVATTDRAFTLVTARGPMARVVRTGLTPWISPWLLKLPGAPDFAFRAVSQTAIAYPDSALSGAGGGERLPWTPLRDGSDNFADLEGFVWRAHLYGDPPAGLGEALAGLGVRFRAFPWDEAFDDRGLERDRLCLLRPDGHIALTDRPAAEPVAAYFKTRGLEPPPLA